MFTRITLTAAVLSMSVLFASADDPRGNVKLVPQPVAQSGSSSKSPETVPTDLAVTTMNISNATKKVAVTVTFESRIGVRQVPVRLRVAGGGSIRFDQTKKADMALNSTNVIVFNVDLATIASSLPPATNPLLPRFLSVTATVDPENAITEVSEQNNTITRIIKVD
ncbi:MAG: hypothetical protein C0467_00315 [Planctomycetaceae bacterium]|nr:hypothetical protein [Planctomycetaceae bacterium]